VRIVLLGAPGAGKGTQAKKISEKFGISHVSTGDILRSELKNNTELGMKANEYMKEGRLVPDELIIEIIRKKIGKEGLEPKFLMDGFPRTLVQAQKFDEMLAGLGISLDKVINIDVDEDELVKRLTSRRVCHECSGICSINNFSSEDEARCPICGGSLYKRKDDEREVIKERLKVYEKQTRPLIDYYNSSGLLVDISGSGSENEIFERVLTLL
jgi:adenylate kinase